MLGFFDDVTGSILCSAALIEDLSEIETACDNVRWATFTVVTLAFEELYEAAVDGERCKRWYDEWASEETMDESLRESWETLPFACYSVRGLNCEVVVYTNENGRKWAWVYNCDGPVDTEMDLFRIFEDEDGVDIELIRMWWNRWMLFGFMAMFRAHIALLQDDSDKYSDLMANSGLCGVLESTLLDLDALDFDYGWCVVR